MSEVLLEAEQAGAPDIDTFYKKVTPKADNTMGIMVSISGYSSVARERGVRQQNSTSSFGSLAYLFGFGRYDGTC